MNELFKDAESFLTLDKNDPEFRLKFILMKDKLVNFRSSDKKEMEYATELIKKINAKYGGGHSTEVAIALQTFQSDIKYGKAEEMYLARVPVPNVVWARSLCERFRKYTNSSIPAGMHKSNNKHALKYALELAQKTQSLYKERSEHFWSSYEEFKGFVVKAASRGTLDVYSMPALAQIVRIVEDEVIKKTYSSDLEELNVFSKVNDIKDKIRVKEKLSQMTYLSLVDLEKLTEYYEQVVAEINNLLREEKLTPQEYNEYNSRIIAEYKALLRPDMTNVLAPLLLFNELVDNNNNTNKMLQFTEQEMLNSFTFASKFIKFFSNESIRDMALNCRKLNVSNINLMLGQKVNSLDRGSKAFADMLLSFGIITPEMYEHDLEILQEG